jgi:hypothetical protein
MKARQSAKIPEARAGPDRCGIVHARRPGQRAWTGDRPMRADGGYICSLKSDHFLNLPDEVLVGRQERAARGLSSKK